MIGFSLGQLDDGCEGTLGLVGALGWLRVATVDGLGFAALLFALPFDFL